jgi:hypothetical protein
MHAVLDHLGIGNRHEAHAEGRVLVSSDDDLVVALGENLPAKRLRPEARQPGQVPTRPTTNTGGNGWLTIRSSMTMLPAVSWSAIPIRPDPLMSPRNEDSMSSPAQPEAWPVQAGRMATLYLRQFSSRVTRVRSSHWA